MGQGHKELKAWVARDEDGMLYLYLAKPRKYQSKWMPTSHRFTVMDEESFTEVRWEDEEPTQVSLTIKRNENSKIKSALKAWVARDDDGILFLYIVKPRKSKSKWRKWIPDGSSDLIEFIELSRESFPEVKWEDEEPTEVSITRKRNEESKIKSALSFLCRIALFVSILLCNLV